MHRIQSLVSLVSSSILAIAACGDLAGKDYPGEALVTLHGTVTNPQALTVSDEARPPRAVADLRAAPGEPAGHA